MLRVVIKERTKSGIGSRPWGINIIRY